MNNFFMSVVIASHETMLAKCKKTTSFTETGRKIMSVSKIVG